ncbi:MAG: hypothetical protein KPEEDBHJ_03066 [Anaerolineales bacterium]|nr:hypothetical protein [Anaerolineales bacterium]
MQNKIDDRIEKLKQRRDHLIFILNERVELLEDPRLAADHDSIQIQFDRDKEALRDLESELQSLLETDEANRELVKIPKSVDITTHVFDVALSFPGEIRSYIEIIVRELERIISPNSYFYDNNYISQLARPSLDILLQDIYKNRSRLVVVFLSGDYQRKEWCGIEFRAIKEIIMERDNHKIMLVKMDDGVVDGIFKTDGYIDGQKHQPKDIARFIGERIAILTS